MFRSRIVIVVAIVAALGLGFAAVAAPVGAQNYTTNEACSNTGVPQGRTLTLCARVTYNQVTPYEYHQVRPLVKARVDRPALPGSEDRLYHNVMELYYPVGGSAWQGRWYHIHQWSNPWSPFQSYVPTASGQPFLDQIPGIIIGALLAHSASMGAWQAYCPNYILAFPTTGQALVADARGC